MKVKFNKGEKLIPERYEDIVKESLFEDFSKKRLTKQERLNLEFEYIKQTLKVHELDYVKDSKPISVHLVETRDSSYYIMKLNNSKEIRCSSFANSDVIKRNY